MKLTSWLHYFWKIPICGLAFFIGLMPGAQLATWIGLQTPAMPAGADQATIAQFTLLASLILALGLAAVARGLSVSFFFRWMILFFLTWIAYAVNSYFEAAIFSTMEAASLYSVAVFLPGSLLCSAAVALLFPPKMQGNSFFAQARTFFSSSNHRQLGLASGSWIPGIPNRILPFWKLDRPHRAAILSTGCKPTCVARLESNSAGSRNPQLVISFGVSADINCLEFFKSQVIPDSGSGTVHPRRWHRYA